MKITISELTQMEINGRPMVSEDFMRSIAPNYSEIGGSDGIIFTPFNGFYPDGIYPLNFQPNDVVEIPDDFRFSYYADWWTVIHETVLYALIPGASGEVRIGEIIDTNQSCGIVYSNTPQEEIRHLVADGYARLLKLIEEHKAKSIGPQSETQCTTAVTAPSLESLTVVAKATLPMCGNDSRVPQVLLREVQDFLRWRLKEIGPYPFSTTEEIGMIEIVLKCLETHPEIMSKE